MEFFLIFVAIVAGISFLKFIWDSYITNNTEKRWQEYKKSNPIRANHIERKPYSSVPDNIKIKPGNLSERIPVIFEFFNMLFPGLRPLATVNDSSRFEFKIPVEVNGKIKGHNHVGIMERHENLELYIFHLSSSGKKITTSNFRLSGNESISIFESNLNYIANELFSKPEYKSEVFGIESNINKASPRKYKYLYEIDSITKLLEIIKNTIVIDPNELKIIKHDKSELEFSFPLTQNDKFWGICTSTIKPPKTRGFQWSLDKKKIFFFYFMTLEIENQDHRIYTAKSEKFRDDVEFNLLLLMFTTLIKELERKDDGFPF